MEWRFLAKKTETSATKQAEIRAMVASLGLTRIGSKAKDIEQCEAHVNNFQLGYSTLGKT